MMENVIEIYANYGCLSAEKKTVYTFGAPAGSAKVSEKMMVKIPDGWELAESADDDTIVIAPWGWPYNINQVLFSKDDNPIFEALDKDTKHYVAPLEVIE